MQARMLSPFLRAVFAMLAAVPFATGAWAADHQSILNNFGNGTDGVAPSGGLIRDSAGNFYGVTTMGGIGGGGNCYFGCGTIFELSPAPGGGWTETVLYLFDGSEGIYPAGSLIMDGAGNLYGATSYDGGPYDGGTIFELSPSPAGWTETVLHTFGDNGNGFDPNDGRTPNGSLVMDAAGNLYGATADGGTHGYGTVFEVSPSQGGGWTETVLYSFGNVPDGDGPLGSVIMDSAGNLYGTTYQGGQGGGFCQGSGCGTVFELSPVAGGGWTETILHSFQANDGFGLRASLVMDGEGNLYGTAYQGGNLSVCAPFGCGTAFELSPVAGGGWTETTLYSFNGQPDAGYPLTPLILDAAGNLYGTTQAGGNGNAGTVFKLSPAQGGWREALPYSFTRDSGQGPSSPLFLDRFGNLYGEGGGGTYDGGIVYELTPPSIRLGPATR